MSDKSSRDLLTTAQEGNLATFAALVNSVYQSSDPSEFSRICHKKSGDAVLHILARNGHTECVRFLLEDFCGKDMVDLEIRNVDGKTALHEAAQHGRQSTVHLLLENGAKVNQLKRADWSPAMLTVTHPGNLPTLKILCSFGADLTLRNKDGWTAFHVAARTGDLDVLKYIQECNPQSWNTISNNGRTPLHTACLARSSQTVSFLLNIGAHVNSADSCGSTPLMDAVRSDCVDTIRILLSHEELVRETVDRLGRTAVHIAAEAGSLASLKLLCEEGFPSDVTTSTGQTPLHSAAREGQTETVKYLIEHGADIDTRDENGRSPLFLAATGQHLPTCQTLIAAGADVMSDKSGVALLDLARKQELKDLLSS